MVTAIDLKLIHPVIGYFKGEHPNQARRRWFKTGRVKYGPLDRPDDPDIAANLRKFFGDGVSGDDLVAFLGTIDPQLATCPFCGKK